jgi:hypothetical protein
MNVDTKQKITYSVCLVHCVFIAFILFKAPLVPAKKQHKPIVVKTVAFKPQVTEKKATPAVSRPARVPAPDTPAVQKSPASVKKLVENKQQTKKVTAPAKTKPVPKAEPQLAIPPSLLRELEESIAKIEEKEDKQTKAKKTKAAALTPLVLQIDVPEHAQSTQMDEDYIAALTEKLHASLHLPDFGEVKIELTLNQEGTVAKLKVLKAESQQNRKYLETELPRLRFPLFSGCYAKQTAHTFTLTFCNES